MKCFEHLFVVIGTDRFPIDMLREDQAFPMTEKDSEKIVSCPMESMTMIFLKHRGVNEYWRPQATKWQSFGWTVMPKTMESNVIDSSES